MRIAMFGQKRIPSREGGVEVVVEELSTRMVNMGHDVTCYNRRGHHVSGREFDTTNMKKYKNVRIKSVPTINGKGLAAVTSSFFAALCAVFGKYDVVHIHAEGPAAMCWLPKLFRKHVVVTVHGLDHQRSDKWGSFAQKYILFGEKCAVRYADAIIVLSRNVKKYFTDTYDRKTIYIPNGVTRPKIISADVISKIYGLKKNEYILYLGRLVPEKGITYLIKAFRDVDTDKKLVIAGGSSDTDEFAQNLKNQAKDDDRIIFTGFVQGKVLEELYSNAYIYVLPSDLEGMPLSLLEAMSYGNCCMVSDISECTEVVEDNAVVFNKGDISDLNSKLQDLCDNPSKVEKYRSEASDFICHKYDWNKVVKQTLSIYKRKKL